LRRSAARLTALAGTLAVTVGTLVAVQVAGASPAGAVPGIEKIQGKVSPTDSQPSKTVRAVCPVGKRVLGVAVGSSPPTSTPTRSG